MDQSGRFVRDRDDLIESERFAAVQGFQVRFGVGRATAIWAWSVEPDEEEAEDGAASAGAGCSRFRAAKNRRIGRGQGSIRCLLCKY